MSFFSFKVRPFFRTLAVVATSLWLALIVAYVADKASNRPKPDVTETSSAHAEHYAHAEERIGARANMNQDERLFGRKMRSDARRFFSVFERSDMELLVGFRTDFMADFRRAFGKRIGRTEKPAPDRSFVVTAVLRSLTLELRSRGEKDVETTVGKIAEYVSRLERDEESPGYYRWKPTMRTWKDDEGFWHLANVREEKEAEALRREREDQPQDAVAFKEALRLIPPAYSVYLRSLAYDDAKALAETETLLALPASERKPFETIARYRRARLTMDTTKWAELSDAEAKVRLARIRDDFAEAARHAANGALDPAEIGDNGRYWIAYTRSMVMPAERLIRLGEADLPGAFATYLGMPERMDSNSVNACFRFIATLCRQQAFAECAKDADLSRLMTMYLTANGDVNQGESLGAQEVKAYSEAWLQALSQTKVSLKFDPHRVALLQYRTGRWKDCMETLKLLPTDEPFSMLLASRCNLRLTGDLGWSYGLTYPGSGPESYAQLANYSFPAPADLPTYEFNVSLDITDSSKVRDRLACERGLLALTIGYFDAAIDDFEARGHGEEVRFIAECVLTIEELKRTVDYRRKARTVSPNLRNRWGDDIGDLDTMLASRLFRLGREEEALAYLPPRLFGKASNYVFLKKLAENPELDARFRADAYWRASELVPALADQLLKCPYAPLVYAHFGEKTLRNHIPYDSHPHLRLNLGEDGERFKTHRLLAPKEGEQNRIKQWIADHYERAATNKDDPLYIRFALAVEAGRLLPPNSPEGAEILQHAGNLLKYHDPDAAVPAFRLLATRYAKTPYGEFAAKHHWFAKEYPSPAADALSK